MRIPKHIYIMNKSRTYLCRTEEGLNFKGGMKNSKVDTRMWVEKLLSVLASHFIGYCWNYSNFLYYKSFKIWWLNEMVFICVGIRITWSFSVQRIICWICLYKILCIVEVWNILHKFWFLVRIVFVQLVKYNLYMKTRCLNATHFSNCINTIYINVLWYLNMQLRSLKTCIKWQAKRAQKAAYVCII